jgi:uridine phosphorylase
LLSDALFDYLQSHYELKQVGLIGSSSYKTPIYSFEYRGETIGVVLTQIGSVLCAGNIAETAYITGASKFVMFGSCGTLDKERTQGKFVIPTEAYRDEGTSYHFMPPSDFVTIKNADKIEVLFQKWGIPYVKGKAWTTDGFLMETVNKVRKRKEAGCIVVEMELASCQAVANYFGLELYDFLQPGDVLLEEGYEYASLHEANHDLLKLDIGLRILEEI